jgi:hypothetical protein
VSLPDIRHRAMIIAETQIGVKEEPGKANHGAQVERYLWSVGLGPGYAWCCAFVVWCYTEAARQLGESQPLKLTGKVARLWSWAPELWRSDRPTVGAIYCHLHEPDDPESLGHCGIVTAVEDNGTFRAVEGNSNRTGSRAGDRVVENVRSRRYPVGFIDIGREGPVESPRIFS